MPAAEASGLSPAAAAPDPPQAAPAALLDGWADDVAEGGVISGWARLREGRRGPLLVRAILDGRLIGDTRADRRRDDLAALGFGDTAFHLETGDPGATPSAAREGRLLVLAGTDPDHLLPLDFSEAVLGAPDPAEAPLIPRGRIESPAHFFPGLPLAVRGWLIAPSPLAEATVTLGGGAARPVQLHLPRLDVGRDHPRYPGAAAAGFLADCEGVMAAAGAWEEIDILLTARTADGTEVSLSALLPLARDPAALAALILQHPACTARAMAAMIEEAAGRGAWAEAELLAAAATASHPASLPLRLVAARAAERAVIDGQWDYVPALVHWQEVMERMPDDITPAAGTLRCLLRGGVTGEAARLAAAFAARFPFSALLADAAESLAGPAPDAARARALALLDEHAVAVDAGTRLFRRP